LGKRELIAAGVAALCLAPSAVCNILPHILAMTANGAADGAAATTAVFQAASVLAMSGMPFAIKNLRAVSLKAACSLLGIVLFVLNFMNALDVASHGRELATGVSRGTLAKAAGLNSRLAELRKSRAQVPPFTFTSAAMVSAAQEAVTAANAARDAECKKVGGLCRKRMDEASAALDRLSAITAQRGLTERAEKLDGEIAALENQLAALGPLPKHGDDTAAKVARIVGLFVTINDGADEAVSEWRPILFAAGIELLAFIGPLGMMAAISGGGASHAPRGPQPKPEPESDPELARAEPKKLAQTESGLRPAKEPVRRPGTGPKTATPAPGTAGVEPTPVTPAPEKKPRQINTKAAAGVGDVREWHKSRTAARAGHRVRVNEVYAAYAEWSKQCGLEAVSLTKFGTVMKGELGVGYAEKSKRGYYTDIALVPALRVVSNAQA
jgi:hypothetical protein